MRSPLVLVLDPRRAQRIAEDILARRPGYVPEWTPRVDHPGDALVRIQARFLEAVLQRLNQAPDKNKLAFLETLGIELIPARSAQAILVARLGDKAVSARLPAGSQVSAPPPPGESDAVVFETESDLGVTAGKLTQIVSLWPGRDQYIDHSAALAKQESFRVFERSRLEDTPHALYLSHQRLLALSGKSRVDVEFELEQPGNRPLDLVWEYWDGKVWRGFRRQHPDCAELGETKSDGTARLTRSGKVRLESDCAKAEQTAVNGLKGYWIRGRLEESLPLDPSRILPEVSQLRLSTVVEHPIQVQVVSVNSQYGPSSTGSLGITVNLRDGDGKPLSGVLVEFPGLSFPRLTSEGRAEVPLLTDPPERLELAASLFGTSVRQPLTYRPPSPSLPHLNLELTLQISGLLPDSAFTDALPVDLSKTFYPLGQQPQPGNAFYFSSQELFSKPGAAFNVHLETAATPQDEFAVATNSGDAPSYPEHRLIWEYWNGAGWFPLLSVTGTVESSRRSAGAFTNAGPVELLVPRDMAVTKVNDAEALWMRVRLASGAFGFVQSVHWNGGDGDNTFSYFVPQPPALSSFRISYAWSDGPVHADTVLTFNDFRYIDRTEEAHWPGTAFAPISQVAEVTPALYLGLDKAFPVDLVSLFFDIEEENRAVAGPALLWEYWNGLNWRPVTAEDGTNGLAHPGIVSFIAPPDAKPLARFGVSLHWIRGRLLEDRTPLESLIRSVHPNAVWASQRQTVREENLGESRGQSNQSFQMRRFPILEGERVEVRELAGARANVEWRLVAQETLGGGHRTVSELEDLVGREGDQQDIEKGSLRLRRDARKRIIEVWVRWEPRRHLLDSSSGDRHYLLDRVTGRLLFGDGIHGRIPPLGARILARRYQGGGGGEGNVAANTITQLLAGVPGVESVTNPLPAEGGADAETLEAFRLRGPLTLHHRGKGLTAGDLETMAREASAAVAVAQVLPTRDYQGRHRPGWITVIVIPNGKEPRPWPSFGLRERVRRYIEERSPAVLAGLGQIHVTGPQYQPVDVHVEAVPVEASIAGRVESAARRAVLGFLHPLKGGPEGRGWKSGRDVYLSDLSGVLERVEGLDHVQELTLLINGEPQGEAAPVPEGKFVVAGQIEIRLRS